MKRCPRLGCVTRLVGASSWCAVAGRGAGDRCAPRRGVAGRRQCRGRAYNHVHGMPEWGVMITLVADGVPQLGVFRQPVAGLTYTALRGQRCLRERLAAHDVGKVRPRPGHQPVPARPKPASGRDVRLHRPVSVTALLQKAFLVRATVPSTFLMLVVAGGIATDAPWAVPAGPAGNRAGHPAGHRGRGRGHRRRRLAVDGGVRFGAGCRAPGVHAVMVEALGEVN